MNPESEFRTIEIDLAAAVFTEIKKRPTVRPGKTLVEFSFKDSPVVRSVVFAWLSGQLIQNVREYAANRGLLYRLVREAAASGGAR